MNSGALLRYNFRVVMFNNWWLLVFPLAASQVTVFWNLITQKYSPALPVQTVEMVSPLVAAFLSAHVLSAEYPSRIGAILASKPVHLGRVVLMRLAAVLALVWALGALSLVAYFFGFPGAMPLSSVVRAALASVPSTLFLALFALTFATLFRHPLAGFGVAMLYWALDLPPGPPIQPYLSLRSLTSALAFQEDPGPGTLTGSWWIAKIVLLVAA